MFIPKKYLVICLVVVLAIAAAAAYNAHSSKGVQKPSISAAADTFGPGGDPESASYDPPAHPIPWRVWEVEKFLPVPTASQVEITNEQMWDAEDSMTDAQFLVYGAKKRVLGYDNLGEAESLKLDDGRIVVADPAYIASADSDFGIHYATLKPGSYYSEQTYSDVGTTSVRIIREGYTYKKLSRSGYIGSLPVDSGQVSITPFGQISDGAMLISDTECGDGAGYPAWILTGSEGEHVGLEIVTEC